MRKEANERGTRDTLPHGARMACSMLRDASCETRKIFSKPRRGEVHEGPHPRRGKPPMRGHQVYRQRRRFVVGEQDLQRALTHMLGHG